MAEESEKIQKIRQKIKKRLDDLEKNITIEALEKKTEEIHSWIARHAFNRVILKDKNISLFDKNQNAAKLSRYVSTALEKLRDSQITSIDLKTKNILP